MLNENIKKLVEYGIQTGLLPETERIYTTNLLLEMFHEDEYEDVRIDADGIRLESVLKELLDYAALDGTRNRREILTEYARKHYL